MKKLNYFRPTGKTYMNGQPLYPQDHFDRGHVQECFQGTPVRVLALALQTGTGSDGHGTDGTSRIELDASDRTATGNANGVVKLLLSVPVRSATTSGGSLNANHGGTSTNEAVANRGEFHPAAVRQCSFCRTWFVAGATPVAPRTRKDPVDCPRLGRMSETLATPRHVVPSTKTFGAPAPIVRRAWGFWAKGGTGRYAPDARPSAGAQCRRSAPRPPSPLRPGVR